MLMITKWGDSYVTTQSTTLSLPNRQGLPSRTSRASVNQSNIISGDRPTRPSGRTTRLERSVNKPEIFTYTTAKWARQESWKLKCLMKKSPWIFKCTQSDKHIWWWWYMYPSRSKCGRQFIWSSRSWIWNRKWIQKHSRVKTNEVEEAMKCDDKPLRDETVDEEYRKFK